MAGQRRFFHTMFIHLTTILLGVAAAGLSFYLLRKFGY